MHVRLRKPETYFFRATINKLVLKTSHSFTDGADGDPSGAL